MTSLQECLPPPGSLNWHRAKSNSIESGDSASSIRHAIIREVWLEKRPKPHAVYKIEVMSNSSHWFVFRRYKEFYNLHQKMAKKFGIPKDFLPPKKFTNSMAIETLEIRREALEHYLQRLINSCDREVSSWPDLLEFLDLKGHDVSLVAMSLARQFAKNGERMIANKELFTMTPVQLHCVTKQLQLPHPQKSGESIDLVHLYDFISQLVRLGITDLVSKATNGKEFEVNYTYDLALFAKLKELQIDGCRISSIAGINSLPQRLRSLTIRRCLNTMKEFLIDCAAEKRPAPAIKELRDSWRTHAAFRLSNKRVIVQPWVSLTSINMSHNNIICLDSSINLLPTIRELDLSYNKMAHLDLSLLEDSPLQRLILVSNEIYLISGSTKTLNNLKKLDLRQNRIQSMEGLLCAQGLVTLDLSHNLIVVLSEVRKLAALENLKHLAVCGNPMAKRKRHRVMVFASFRHRELELDGQQMTNKEKAKLDAKFGTENETDFDDSMSISTVSDDDLDSGIDGHVPSLEPLFEEEDYVVVDRDMNLDLSKQCDGEDNVLERVNRDRGVIGNREGGQLAVGRKRGDDLSQDRARLESFGSYRESYAANWKPGTCVGGAKKRTTQQNPGGSFDSSSDEKFHNTNVMQRSDGTSLRRDDSDLLQKRDEQDKYNDNNRNGVSNNKYSRTPSGIATKDPSITSFDKLIRSVRSSSPKNRKSSGKQNSRLLSSVYDGNTPTDNPRSEFPPERTYSPRTIQDSESLGYPSPSDTEACAGDASSADLEVSSSSGLISTKYGNKNIVILPEVSELRIQDYDDEDELWNGEDACEAGTECDESDNDN